MTITTTRPWSYDEKARATKDIRTIEDMFELAVRLDADKHDRIMRPVFTGRQVVVDEDLIPVTIEDHAIQLLSGALGRRLGAGKPVPSAFLKWIPDDLFADNLNRLLTLAGDPKFLLRCHRDRLRAVVSEKYPNFGLEGVFENQVVAGTIREVARQLNGQYRLVDPYITRDTLVARLLFHEVRTDDGNYGIGWYAKNNEIAAGKFSIGVILKRGACDNTIAFDTASNKIGAFDGEGEWQGGFRAIPHIGGREKFLVALGDLAAAHETNVTAAMEYLNSFLFARQIVIKDMTQTIAEMTKAYGWSEPVSLAVAVGTEGQGTLHGLVNGITFAAHDATESHTQQLELEELGGAVLLDLTRKATVAYERTGRWVVA